MFRYIFFNLYKKINPKSFLLINIFNYKMLIPMQYDGIGRSLYVYGSRELDHKWMLDEELFPGNVVLDLGANIGYYAIMEAKRVGSSGKIYAIEPDPRNIELLKKNIKLNDMDKIFDLEEGAISNEDKKTEFILSTKTNLSSFDLKKDTNNLNSISVQTHDIGSFLKNKKRVDLIRMDIEGHEIEVFESLVKFSKNFKNHLPKKIIFETHLGIYKKKKKNVRNIFEKLFTIGYEIKFFSSSNEPKEVLKKKGLFPFKIIKDYPFKRGIYKNIDQKDFIYFATETGGLRTVLLELKKE